MANGLFVIGTGTDVGKTYVTGLLVKALHESGAKAAYYKAAMSGNKRNPDGTLCPGDAAHVKAASGIPQPLDTMCPYVYERAVSPHLATRLEGNPVNQTRVLDELAHYGNSTISSQWKALAVSFVHCGWMSKRSGCPTSSVKLAFPACL